MVAISPKDDLLQQLRLLHEAVGEIPPDAMVDCSPNIQNYSPSG